MASGSGNLQGIVEQLTHFRSEVRAVALAHRNDPATASLRNPLLKACDTIRKDLAPLGVLIKVYRGGSDPNESLASPSMFTVRLMCVSCSQDRGATSTWEITEGKQRQTEQSVQDQGQDTSS